MTDRRQQALGVWLKQQDLPGLGPLCSLNGDASFRRYFRTGSYIAVDAPPDTQKNAEFIDIAIRLHSVGIRVPQVLRADLSQGFMLLEDLGDRVFAGCAVGEAQARFYRRAAALLAQLAAVRSAGLPLFDRAFILQELNLCPQWLLQRRLGLALTPDETQFLNASFELLTTRCLQQAQTAVHRDFHSRNLMVLPDDSLAVLDFQDMVRGPVLYDLASLLFDCYVVLPEDLVQELGELSLRRFKALGVLPATVDLPEFWRQLQTVSLQRHIKVLGIFCRLSLRDGKHGYLKDLPRVWGYVKAECAALPEFRELGEFLAARIEGGL